MASEIVVKASNNINETYEIVDVVTNHDQALVVQVQGLYRNNSLSVKPYEEIQSLIKIVVCPVKNSYVINNIFIFILSKKNIHFFIFNIFLKILKKYLK